MHLEFLLRLNDVVLVKDDTTRGNWKFGKVTKLQKSRDGITRSEKVLTPSGKEIRKPLNLHYPLEITDKSCSENEKSIPKTKEESYTNPLDARNMLLKSLEKKNYKRIGENESNVIN